MVVVGSGAAGMSAALAAAGHGLRVLLISKENIGGGATPLAQGGLAAALGPGDSEVLHQRDTAAAGAGLCDPARWPRWPPRRPGRSGGWPCAGPGWAAARCTGKAGTAGTGSCTPAATRPGPRCTGCCAASLLTARSIRSPSAPRWTC